jgi:hypothetical protein
MVVKEVKYIYTNKASKEGGLNDLIPSRIIEDIFLKQLVAVLQFTLPATQCLKNPL